MTRNLRLCILFSLIIIVPAGGVFAGATLKTAGVLTEKDGYGDIVVNGNNYKVEISTSVQDDRGNSTTLDKISLESRVYLEYEITREAAVVKLLKVLPQ